MKCHCGGDITKNGPTGGKQKYSCNSCGDNVSWKSEMWRDLERERLEDESINNSETPKVAIEQNGNSLLLSASKGRITTLQKLIEATETDLDKWVIKKHKINKWDTTLKLKDGSVTVSENCQINAELFPKELEAIEFPLVAPIIAKSTYVHTKPKTTKIKQALVFGDHHVGFNDKPEGKISFHDVRVMDLQLQIADIVKPDLIIDLGDLIDVSEHSDKFTKEPGFYFQTQRSLIVAHEFLSAFNDVAPNATKEALRGNHEARIERAFTNHYLAACGLKPADSPESRAIDDVAYWLGLDSIGWGTGTLDRGVYGHWVNNDVYCSHGSFARKNSGAEANVYLEDARHTHIHAHTHRLHTNGITRHSRRKDVVYYSESPGCSCKIDGSVPAVKGKLNWQQGAMIVTYEEGDGNFGTEAIKIFNGECMFRNMKLVATDATKMWDK